MGTRLKRAKVIISLFLLISLIILSILLIMERSKIDLFEGKTGYSGSIAESKRLNVFISEYKLFDDSICLGDEYFIPGEIWVERVWKQGNYEKPVITTEPNAYSNYWLYIQIPKKEFNKTKKYFDQTNNNLAIETVEGTTFWQRKCGTENFFVVSFKKLPAEEVELKVLGRRNTTDKAVIPTKWINPILVDKVTLVKK